MILHTLAVTLCLPPLTAALAMADTSPADVIGTWQTEVAARPTPDGSTAYLRTMTAFTEQMQELVVSIYADPALEMRLFEYSSGGPWDPQGPAEGVAGAMAVNMTNAYSLVTIFVDAPDLWAGIGLAECPLVIGEAVDITGCVNGPPFLVTDCIDLDIVMVDEDGRRLRYGGGGVDRCVTRPTELSTDAFFRME
jgi:hypothetical protein